MTTSGFLSVVAHDRRRDAHLGPSPAESPRSDALMVRARLREDLTAMLDGLELPGSMAVSTPGADYPYRAVLTRDQWSRFLAIEVGRIDYGNFKSRVQELQGSRRHDLYLRVWSALRGLERLDDDDGPTEDSALW